MKLTTGANSRWTGKKWACVGDSITNANNTGLTKIEYYQYIASWIGMTTLNYGVNGTGWRTPSAFGGTNAIYQRLGSIDSTSDLITVFAGTNDWAQVGLGMNLGTFGDTSASTSLYGAIDQTLSALVSSFPTKTIAVFTPLQRTLAWYNQHYNVTTAWTASTVESTTSIVVPTVANGFSYACTVAGTTGTTEPTWPTTVGNTVVDGSVTWQCIGANPTNVSLQDVSNAIIAVANKYNVPVLDLYKNGNVYAQNSTFVSTYMDAQGLHPNTALHQILAYKILDFLNSI